MAVALLAAMSPGLAAYELPALLGVPFPTELSAATRAPRLSWIADTAGVRNVWTALGPQFEPVRVTDFRQDDGQALADLHTSADGSVLVWVRGGPSNRQGFSPNPASLPGGAKQEVWAAGVPEGNAHTVAVGHAPVISPDDRVVLVEREHTLHCYPLRPDTALPDWCTSPLLKIQGDNIDARFSPKGDRIAFVSDRNDRSFVGVLDLRTQRIMWLAPGADRDTRPQWSPDGTRIAFLRIAGKRPGELFDTTGAWPFEIWIADTASGAGRRIFRSSPTAGGYSQIATQDPLRWTPTDQLIFYSEQSGWQHLYAIAPQGGVPLDLTPGSCEAETSTVAAHGSAIIVSSNCADLNGRQLSQIALPHGESRPIPGLGIDTNPLIVGPSSIYAWRGADAVQPTSVMMRTGDNAPRKLFPILPSDYPATDLVRPEVVSFNAADGVRIYGQLFSDPRYRGRRPALVFVHGGPARQMLPGWHYAGYYRDNYALNQFLAHHGFIVLSVNFRSGTGYGQRFRRAENQGPRGVAEYQDVLAAHRYLRTLGAVDARRIGIWGGSYGGFLTATALARNSNLFAAGVDFHGVHDWRQFSIANAGEGWGISEAQYGLAYASSPIAHLAQWRSPVLLIHGDDDRNVPFSQTIDLYQQLRLRHISVELLVFPDEVHSFLRYATVLRSYEATFDFFCRTLHP